MALERLVIGSVDQRSTVGLQSEAQCQSSMVHVSRFDSDIGDLKIAFDELVITDLGAHLIEPHREISVLHLSGQRVLHGLPEPLGRVDVPLVSRLEKWGKEWNSLDVIPMRMTKENMALTHGARRYPTLGRDRENHFHSR